MHGRRHARRDDRITCLFNHQESNMSNANSQGPKGYWIVHGDVHDVEQYKVYVQANAAPLKEYGARFLVRGGPFEAVEGASRARHVVIEFPSVEAARACWHSPGYQAAIALRRPVSEVDLLIIGGYEGPQPGEAG